MALDYSPVLLRMERMGLSDDEHAALWADVRVIEGAALATIKEVHTRGN